MKVHYEKQRKIQWAKTREGWAKKREEDAKRKADKALELAEERIKTRVANAARAVKLKQAAREERQQAFAELEEDLKDAGLAGTPEARLRKQVLTAEHSLNKHTQVKGGYAQMTLDMMQNAARASEARERAARGEFSAGVRLT